MKFRYSNDLEDKKAIELINSLDVTDFDGLETELRKANLPLRERYVFYFISKQHQNNPKEKKLWGTESSNYKYHTSLYYWWDHYLEYERVVKLKLRAEISPELPKLDPLESYDLKNLRNLHPEFIKRGYEYLDNINKSLAESLEVPLDDDSYTYTSSKPSLEDICKELDALEEEFAIKLIQIETEKQKNTGWCPACSESPCMCSDPY